MESSVITKIDYNDIKIAAKTVRAINNNVRRQIVKVIEENERINVTEIYVKMRIEQSVVSQHLAILRDAKIVSPEREGRTIFYSLNIDRIAQVARIFDDNLLLKPSPAN